MFEGNPIFVVPEPAHDAFVNTKAILAWCLQP